MWPISVRATALLHFLAVKHLCDAKCLLQAQTGPPGLNQNKKKRLKSDPNGELKPKRAKKAVHGDDFDAEFQGAVRRVAAPVHTPSELAGGHMSWLGRGSQGPSRYVYSITWNGIVNSGVGIARSHIRCMLANSLLGSSNLEMKSCVRCFVRFLVPKKCVILVNSGMAKAMDLLLGVSTFGSENFN